MLSFPIIDTHVHLFNPDLINYHWLKDVPSLNRSWFPADFSKATDGVEVSKIVFLQCDAAPDHYKKEADWVSSLAKDEPRIAGMVPRARVELGAAVREELEGFAKDPLTKGVRRLIQEEPDIDFCVQPAFVEGVQQLSDFGFSFDLCIFHFQLANTIKLVEQCPDVPFVLDHIGKPAIKDGLMDPWKEELVTLASFPNVACKLSGMVTEADHEAWTEEQLKPYIDHVVETFGFDRLMFGGDWPVSTLAASYTCWVKTVLNALAGVSQDDLKKLFVETAEKVYRI